MELHQGFDPVFDPQKWSHESIHKFYQEEQDNAWSRKEFRTVFRISGDAVVKHVHDSEIIVTKLVLKTKILTPRILLEVEHVSGWYVILEHIEGRTLAEAWPSMLYADKEIVINTLHEYVVQLRAIKDDHSSRPGPLGPSPRVCDTFQLGFRAQGPFNDYSELTCFLNTNVDAINRYYDPPRPLEPFTEDWPLVLIHNDLNMTNIMIDNKGKVCLIDWGMSGYYSQYFDQYAMVRSMPSLKQPSDWVTSIPRVTGDYPKEMEKLRSIQKVLN